MPANIDTTALYSQIKLALLREVYRRNLLTETQLSQLIQRQQTQ